MINIYLNSKKIALNESRSLHDELEINGMTSGKFAIAVNRVFVPRGQYDKTQMNDGDEIDVVFPMQGG